VPRQRLRWPGSRCRRATGFPAGARPVSRVAQWRAEHRSCPGVPIITETLFSAEYFHAIRVAILHDKHNLRATAARTRYARQTGMSEVRAPKPATCRGNGRPLEAPPEWPTQCVQSNVTGQRSALKPRSRRPGAVDRIGGPARASAQARAVGGLERGVGAPGVRPRVFGAPIGFIGAPTRARERPRAPTTNPRNPRPVMFEAAEIPRRTAYHPN